MDLPLTATVKQCALAQPMIYTPSKLSAGEKATLREHSFTSWMSPDLKRAASDFNRNICHIALYAECSTTGAVRYLFWRPPQGSLNEVRSGRTYERFKEFDDANIERGWALLSLHINESQMYSGVWISSCHYECGVEILAGYGITPARRETTAA